MELFLFLASIGLAFFVGYTWGRADERDQNNREKKVQDGK